MCVGTSRKADHVRCLILDELFQLLNDHMFELSSGLGEVIVDKDRGSGRHALGDARSKRPVTFVLPDAPLATAQCWPDRLWFRCDVGESGILAGIKVRL